jgi:hypothetical protein
VHVDLAALFGRLGVRRDGEGVAFDEHAELAHVRRAIGSADRPVRAVRSAFAAPASHTPR